MSKGPGLEAFKAEMQKGLARPNRFFVVLPGNAPDNRIIGMFCENAQLPGSNILTTPSRVFGEIREMPYERAYDPINLSFYVDSDFKVKEYFDKWLEEIFDPVTRSGNYYEKYAKNIEIWVHNVEDNRTYAVVLKEAYPKSVSAVSLDYGSKDIMKLQVTMQYKYWRSVAGISAASESALAGIDQVKTANNMDGMNSLDFNNVFGSYFNNSFGGVPATYLNSFQGFQDSFNSFANVDPMGSFMGGSFGSFKI